MSIKRLLGSIEGSNVFLLLALMHPVVEDDFVVEDTSRLLLQHYPHNL
jgi:hypothetical protein